MKVDIIIKSFNRPYYLERCLQSIYLNISGDFQIKVLDDGTPDTFLDLIKQRYPDVSIHYSPFSSEKKQSIYKYLAGEIKVLPKKIPGNFWYNEIAESSDIILLLEDDIWINEKISLSSVCDDMRNNDLIMLKTSWLGNKRLVTGIISTISDTTQEVRPLISFATQAIVLNRFWIRSVIHRLGILDATTFDLSYQLPLYSLYTVAAAFFKKNYWLYLWEDKQEKVDELLQLKKAWKWYNEKGDRYGKTVIESSKTSFLSSATNSFVDIDFDMIHFNNIISGYWLKGEFDSMENFPNDFSEQYICSFLTATANPRASYEGWKAWTSRFKHQYVKFGCEVE